MNEHNHWPLAAALGIATALMSTGFPAPCAAMDSMRGIYALSDPHRPIPQRVMDKTYVDGLALRYFWDDLEPEDGAFNWSRIDRDIELARSHRKKVSLSITPGIHTPGWVYAAGAASFRFMGRTGPSACGENVIPIPWDSVFLAKWNAFVRALGHRYGSNAALAGVKITGVNSVTQEIMLPHALGGFTGAEGVSCPRSDDIAKWIQAGYTRAAVLRAWGTIGGTFAQSFPNKQIAVMLVPGGFPRVDRSGTSLPGQRKDSGMAHDIIADGIRSWGRRFVVQNNGLSAFWIWKDVKEAARQTAIGYQMLGPATGDHGCRMNHGISPCDPRTVLEQAIGRGVESGAGFLEIYIPDILNPDLQQVITRAHSRLVQGVELAPQ